MNRGISSLISFRLQFVGFFVIYIVVFTVDSATIPYKSAQIICCLIPPIGLQIGAGAFLKSYGGIDISAICGILFADIFIYTALAWYFSQVWWSKVGVPKPWYFPLLSSYWFPKKASPGETELHPITLEDAAPTIPTEKVNERLLGAPTVVVNKLRKTFGQQVSVNDLSFSMYENQIFALLGHNGAGKVSLSPDERASLLCTDPALSCCDRPPRSACLPV
jgi:hypothetical protein